MYDTIVDWESLRKLPIDARREIIDLIEESIELDYEQELNEYPEETEEEIQILNERLQEDILHPEDGVSWEKLKNELLTRKK